MSETGIGKAIERREDERFLRGQGRYTDDLHFPGEVAACFVRSPHAHARIRGIDAEEARRAPGVIAVYTGADLAADGVGGIPCGWLITGSDGSPMHEPPHYPLARDTVRYVGDHVAVVIAESFWQAKDAAELVEVDYEMLEAVTATADALDPGAPKVHEDLPDNRCYTWALGDADATDAAFRQASHVSRVDIVNNRLIPNAIEPRAVIATHSPGEDRYTLYTSSQNPHLIRMVMCAFVLAIPEHKLRVVAPDVGGGFGSKIYHYAEEAVLTWASKKVGRPIRWTAERSESFLSDAHGRDHVTTAEMAMDEQGHFLGLRVKTTANLGAYLSLFASCVPTILYATLLAGQYRTPQIHCEVTAVFTHTAPVDAYRGAGRPEATYVLERLVTQAAWDMGLTQDEIRRRNFIPKDAFPYQTPVALTYDVGDYEATLERAMELADVAGFEQRRQESERRGRRRGLGYSTYIEACGLAPSRIAGALGARAGLYESGQIRLHPTGKVTVFTGSHSHGQGHETTFAQIVSERLGLPIEDVEVVHGDTDRVPFGMGTYGSRSLAVGGSALMRALDKIIAKSKKIAAHMLEASEDDVEYDNGVFRIAGTDRQLAMAEVAFSAYVPHNYPLEEVEPGLDETAFYDPSNFTYPAGSHICEVEVDPDTGRVEIVSFTAVDDFGNVINPMIVEGQVHGGLAQGIGQALLEGCVYDPDSGQLVTGTYMDYTMPRADDLPSFRVDMHGTPCTHNPLGVKGCGEAGAIGAPPAVINAVLDALRPLGVEHLDMPATPHRVWQAIQAARGRAAA
ncbi:xanthine dehydrogenase family protein molybdopterin-binding subunit [Spiribacter halobius]|uniref:Carbon monoxide dehydrogenase n=1 Tax=Sediminicurvatus halobius TaxID=2182432 RepID=A0A2U2N0G1_9GAMM|nr:xanthine dehydrogenase family protein molybdopterin-binding subunit [Spiribacter halobius]PWG62610.1 carbon monoxide dehydrogenase [Spiribacter halobius]UEX78471.1 xanthine dehydrogenase family protein molybdopterin-binding subunit [Spiribacter halobius]